MPVEANKKSQKMFPLVEMGEKHGEMKMILGEFY